MADYATPQGETPPFGGPFAPPRSPLTAIQAQGENALDVSGRGERPPGRPSRHRDDPRAADGPTPHSADLNDARF